MIQASVFTNQDDVVCNMKKFLVLPREGDKVEVRYKGSLIYSKVISIIHRLDANGNPFVEIELWSETIHRMNKN